MCTNSMEQPYTPISEVGEFGLINRLHSILGAPDNSNVIMGIDDDAAVYRIGENRVHVITTDALIEGVHFDRAMTPMNYLGFKALSVNVSDIVAMNARPLYATITLSIPNNVSIEMVESLYEGLREACDYYGVTLLGGDTTGSRWIALSVTVVGEATEDTVSYRHGAQPGDILCVSGKLGGAYAGLKVLLGHRNALQAAPDYQPELAPYSEVIRRQLRPQARLDLIQKWQKAGIRPHAMIDISDGLASEIHHICRLSGVGARIAARALPIDSTTKRVAAQLQEDADTYALFGGEDYELLFALPAEVYETLDDASITPIGVCTDADEGIRIETPDSGEQPLSTQGYQHFPQDEESKNM